MNIKILSITIGIVIIVIIGVFFFIRDDSKKSITTTTPVPPVTKIVIVAFGDSLTAGYGGPLEDGYPSILEKKLADDKISATVINMGVSGETTSGGLERVQFVLDQKPDIILLGLGANDMLRSLSPTSAKANLETIIKALQKENKKIILLGMKSSLSNGLSYTKEFNAIYPDLSKKYSLPLVPFFLDGVALVTEFNTTDGIHPNRLGYEKIVDENILPVLLPYIKKNF